MHPICDSIHWLSRELLQPCNLPFPLNPLTGAQALSRSLLLSLNRILHGSFLQLSLHRNLSASFQLLSVTVVHLYNVFLMRWWNKVCSCPPTLPAWSPFPFVAFLKRIFRVLYLKILLTLSEVKSLSRAQLFVTPWTVACQDPPSMGFSRQEYWSGHFLLQDLTGTFFFFFLM